MNAVGAANFPLRNRAPAAFLPVSLPLMNVRSTLVPLALVLLWVGPVQAETAGEVIARARAYLGTESALNAVRTIHFSGRLEGTEKVRDSADKTKTVDQPVSLPAEIIFQKPYQQLITLVRPDAVETTALDDYDAWQRRTNPAKPGQWTVNLLDGGQIKRLRANTWENLSFFAGLEKKGGHVQAGEDTTVEGVVCAKLSFVHDDNIVFIRYFEKNSGRLIKTVTESGTEIREEGELFANGVRFPRKVISKAPNGQVTVIVFDRVVVNETVPAGEFAVPALRAN